ncbi:MAG: NAD(P)H-hydrate dehydratase, partial [Paucibacter sp.]|nr:NAD(P)H-hydrate dehydratase [Roseateles sp.]
PALLPERLELMHWSARRFDQVEAWQDLTLICGCGGGTAVQGLLPLLLPHAKRLVLDADALNAVAADPALQGLLGARAAQSLSTVLTPHPLEAARLAQHPHANDIQHQRLNAAQALAERFQCTVVLKGSGTVCAAPGRTPIVNKTGNGALATAGTGDVLAGWLGGLWAQAPGADPHTLAALAASWHGLAATQFAARQGGPLLAMDLIQSLRSLHPAPTS